MRTVKLNQCYASILFLSIRYWRSNLKSSVLPIDSVWELAPCLALLEAVKLNNSPCGVQKYISVILIQKNLTES